MKRTTVVFVMLFVALGFLTMSFAKERSALLGASNTMEVTLDLSNESEEGTDPLTVIFTMEGWTRAQDQYVICQTPTWAPLIWVQGGAVERLAYRIDDQQTAGRLMNAL